MTALKSRYRTHTCGELRPGDVGSEVTLAGWVVRKRDHGGVVFVDLRDNYGITQVVFNDTLREDIQRTRVESVISVAGKVTARDDETRNPKLATGEVEVHVSQLTVLSASEVLPFQIAEDDNAPEATRLKSRFLELRRDKLHENMQLRAAIIRSLREIMQEIALLGLWRGKFFEKAAFYGRTAMRVLYSLIFKQKWRPQGAPYLVWP